MLHLNIENIHHMRRSLDELTDICEPLNVGSWEADWYSKVDTSLWLRHLRLVLGGTHEIIRLMQVEHKCVVCHCSDGWDRTAQLCALAELLMDPWYRSVCTEHRYTRYTYTSSTKKKLSLHYFSLSLSHPPILFFVLERAMVLPY